jgi:SSS family solute:Na+ symporter
MFWKRATGHGAFAGLIAGSAAALLHHGLTLPIDAHPGMQGGWIAVVHSYPSDLAQNFWTVLFALGASVIVTVAVSLGSRPKPEPELAGLVRSLTPRQTRMTWWKRPEALAVAILLAAISLTFFLG